MSKESQEWDETLESSYVWEHPKRKSIYIFDAQLRMLQKIAKERNMRMRHVFFECFQLYIGTYLTQEKESDEKKK